MKQQELNKFCYDYAKLLESWVSDYIYLDFSLTVKLDWSQNRRHSRGGIYSNGPGINMAMNSIYPNNNGQIYRFYEYPSFDADKTIGGFYSKNPIHKTKALLIHETAHAVQYFSYDKTHTRCKPHGVVFKKFYQQLRKQFLNYELPDQIVYKTQYDAYVNQINKTNANTLRQVMLANS